MIDCDKTIVAIASPQTPATRGIVRLSGFDAADVLVRCGIRPPESESAAPKMPVRFDAGLDVGTPLGRVPVSVMFWPTRRSYTGQPSIEIHTYGSLPVLQAIVDQAVSVGGARSARPGEFTLRAFLAGRLDLTQAEAVLGVIEAEQRGSLDQALSQLAGNLSRPLEQMRSDLLDLLADVEAGLDFVDEDIEFIAAEDLIDRLNKIRDVLSVTAEAIQSRGRASATVAVAVRGAPNAGKSQLINRLCGHDATIVADVAGTTRDVVVVETKVGESMIQLIDTAGIEIVDDHVSTEAQSQAMEASRGAAIRLWCVDLSRDDFHAAMTELQALCDDDSQSRRDAIDIWIGTKNDLQRSANTPLTTKPMVSVSSFTGDGIAELEDQIEKAVLAVDRQETGSVVGTAARCRQSIENARHAIGAAINLATAEDGQEFVSAEIRMAVESLGEVTGAVYTDDILDRVFGRFCIGK